MARWIKIVIVSHNSFGYKAGMVKTAPTHTERSFDSDKWVDRYGDYLYHFALGVVHDPLIAEELVQETFVGALRSAAKFGGRASERTWLTAILKNKIVDHFRAKAGKEQYVDDFDTLGPAIEKGFETNGKWKLKPTMWRIDPEDHYSQKQFLAVFYRCMSELPKRLARIFQLREIDGLDTDELCKEMEISRSNSWVMLYRARMGLRKCLEDRWISKNAK